MEAAICSLAPRAGRRRRETCQFPAIIHPGAETATPSAKIFKYFAGNASVTVKGRKGLHHTPYASVSISDGPVSECDRGVQTKHEHRAATVNEILQKAL